MLANRVQEYTSTAGTGTLDLSGATGTDKRTFVTGFGNGGTARYKIENADGTAWEIGIGVVTQGTPDTLTRATVIASTNSNAAVNFGVGTKTVTVSTDADALRFGPGVLPVAGGSANARTIAHAPAKTALVDGEKFWFINGAAPNVGAATLNVDSTGAKSVLRPNGGALQDSDMPATTLIGVVRRTAGDCFWLLDIPVVAATSSGAGIVELATDAEAQTGTDADRAVTPHALAAAAAYQGRQAIPIQGTSILPRATNGAAFGSTETSSSKVMLAGLDFDASTIEYGQFACRMPKSWNEGTVTAVFVWEHGSTTTNFKVSWGLQAVALSDGDAGDTAFGTAQYANDTGGTTGTIYISPETSAITIAGSPAAEDWVVFQVLRKADDGTNDTLAIDARLLGVTLYIVTDAKNDL